MKQLQRCFGLAIVGALALAVAAQALLALMPWLMVAYFLTLIIAVTLGIGRR